ncbi:MAG: kelch motif-containing protein [Deltaproteobacteria bacterium]|nr:kelch motif-containing protein [Deltaproteobacteria bacterium]
MYRKVSQYLVLIVLSLIITGCPEDKISISINLIPPCISDSKNFKNPMDNLSEIAFVATKEDPNTAPEVLTSVRYPYESGGKGVFDIPLSKNVRILVEGFDDKGNMVLRGASKLFDVTVNSPTNIKIPIFIAGTDAFSQTTDFSQQECSNLSLGLQGTTVTPLPNGDVLIVGGVSVSGSTKFYSSSLFLYNSQNGTFEEIEIDDQIKEYGKRAYHTATLYNKGTKENPEWRVLIAGGETFINGVASSVATAQIYDVKSKKVEFLSSTMEEGRMYHTATLMQNGKIIIIGGENKVNGKVEAYLDTVEIFDTQTETFSKLTGKEYHRMTHARSRHTATYLPLRYNTIEGEPVSGFDKILIAGGIKKVDTQLYINDEMEIFGCANANCTDYRFDVVRKKDNTSLKMTKKRYGHQAVAVMTGSEPIGNGDEEFHNFFVVFLGGYGCIGFDRCAGSTSLDCQCPDNDVYKSLTTSVEILDPTNPNGPQFISGTDLNAPRADFGAVVVNRESDNIVIFGGFSAAQGYTTDSVEYMTVNKKKGITKPRYAPNKMLFQRADFGFGILLTGEVLVVGGDNGKMGANKSSLQSAEIFTPAYPPLSE